MNYSEAGIVIYIQRAQVEICAVFSGRNEAPIVRHSNAPSWGTAFLLTRPTHFERSLAWSSHRTLADRRRRSKWARSPAPSHATCERSLPTSTTLSASVTSTLISPRVNETSSDHNVEKQFSDFKGGIAYLMVDSADVSEEDVPEIYDKINKTPANIHH